MQNLCITDFFGPSDTTIFFTILSIFLGLSVAFVIFTAIKFKIEGLEKLTFWLTAMMVATAVFAGSSMKSDEIENKQEYAKFLTYALTLEDTERIYISNFKFEDKSILTSSENRLEHIAKSKSVYHENSLVKATAIIYGSTNFEIEGNFVVTPVYGYEGPAYMEYVDIKAQNKYGLPSGLYNKVLYVPAR